MSRRSRFTPPRRDEVEARLVALVEGTADLVETSDWAGQWVENEAAVTDRLVFETLATLWGVDMPNVPEAGGPERLLFGPEDYAAWLEEFRAERSRSTEEPPVEERRDEVAPPAPDEVEAQLVALVNGAGDVAEIAKWAGELVLDEDATARAEYVQDALASLCGVDIPKPSDADGPGGLLFGPDDYAAWLRKFRAARAAGSGQPPG